MINLVFSHPLYSLETWLKIANKCPVCNAITHITQIRAPLYFSSSREGLQGKSQVELETLLVEATRKRKRDKEYLKESRIANKFLGGELKKYKELAQKSIPPPIAAELTTLKLFVLEILTNL
jgi:hypothetical protein